MGRLVKKLLFASVLTGWWLTRARGMASANVCEANSTTMLTFLQVVPLTGSYKAVGTLYNLGLRAAFEAYNRDPAIGVKAQLTLQVKNDGYDPTFAQSAVTNAFASDDIFAVVGMLSTEEVLATYPIAVDRQVPFIGARTGEMSLRTPFQRYVVNFRVSYFDEAAALVEHLVARQFRRIAVFWQDDAAGQAGLDGIRAALSSKSLEICGHGKHTKLAYDSLLDTEISMFLKSMITTSITPDAIVLATVDRPAATFVMRARALWPHVFFGGMSCTNPELLQAELLNQTNATILDNMVFAQLTPLLSDTSIPVVSQYRTALALVNSSCAPSAIGLEGYLVGRLVTSTLERINGNFTRERFLDGLYKPGFYDLDGLRCGPFLPEDVDGGCNQCMHQVMFVTPLQNRSFAYVEHDHIFNFSTCGYKPYEWTRMIFAQSCSYTGIPGPTCRAFRDGVFAAFKQVNDRGGLRGSMKLQLVTDDDLDDEETAYQNNLNFLNDPEVFGLIGTSTNAIDKVIEHAVEKNKPVFGAFSGVESIRSPFQRSVINFRVSQGDEVSAIVHYCYYQIKIKKIALLYENSTLGHAGKAEIEEHLADKRMQLHSFGLYSYTDLNLTEAIYSIFFGPTGLPEAVVIIGYADVLADMLLEAHALNRDIYVFALSQTVTTNLQAMLNSSDAKEYLDAIDLSKLIISQTVPAVSDLSIPAVANYTAALARYDDLLSATPAGLEGYLVGRLVATAVQRVMGDPISSEAVVDAVYDSGSFNFFGTRCGPFVDQSSSSSCNQCMKRVWLTGISNDGQSYHEVDHSFTFSTCMYELSRSLDFDLNGMRLMMLVMASVGNGFVLLVLIAFVQYRKSETIQDGFLFSVVTCLGCMMSFSSVYVLYPIPTDLTCMLEPWGADLSFVLLYGSLVSKTHRIDKIFNDKRAVRERIKDSQMLGNFLALLVAFVGHLVAWTMVSPRRMVESWTLDGIRFESCASPILPFQYVSWVMKALVLLWGCFLSTRVGKITGQFAEMTDCKAISSSLYNSSFAALISFVLVFTMKDPNMYFMSFTCLLIMNTAMVALTVCTRPLLATTTISTSSRVTTGSRRSMLKRSSPGIGMVRIYPSGSGIPSRIPE